MRRKGRKGMIAAVAAFAASPQGRRYIQQAKDYVTGPEGKQKISELRAQATRKRRPSRSTPQSGF